MLFKSKTSITNTNKTHRQHEQTRSVKGRSQKKLVRRLRPTSPLICELLYVGVRVEGRATSGEMRKDKRENENI